MFATILIEQGVSLEKISKLMGHKSVATTFEIYCGIMEASFPIGGAGTHCVITGHTGLSRAKLFTDLVELKKGDLFF